MQIFCYKDVKVATIDDLLKFISKEAAKVAGCEENVLYTRLLEREKISPTGIGKGVLLPHIRHEKVKDDLIFFFVLFERLEYTTPDGQDIKIVFFIVSPADKKSEYLRLVSSIVRLIKKEIISDISDSNFVSIKERLYEYLTADRG